MKKMRGVERLPLFPLPLVMLPNEILPLHIFEDRYQQMLIDVQAGNQMFGVLLFEPVEDFIERPDLGTVGCVAEVRDTDMIEDGRSNIVTLGIVRFRLIEYIDVGTPYFVGDVEFFEDDEEDGTKTTPLADTVFELFQRIAKAAFRMSGGRGRLPDIPRGDAEQLSFLVTAAFNFENELKYNLLEMTSTYERLEKLRGILRKMVDQMEESAEIHSSSKTNGHSKKKLDFECCSDARKKSNTRWS